MINGTIRTLFLAMLVSLPALAHTPLKATVPASGAVLTESPAIIEFEFAKPVRLTLVRIDAAGLEGRKLEFAPQASSARFDVKAPDLALGRNEIHWTALSPDGHVIDGVIVLVLDKDPSPAAAASANDN